MKVQAWVEIRNDFAWPAEDPADDTELQAKNRVTLSYAGDIDVVPFIFKGRTQGPRTWRVYSLLYTDIVDDQDIEQRLERFKSENPGQTGVLAAWYEDGAMVGCQLVLTEVPNPDYVGEPYWIPNPDYQPDPELPDYDDRVEIKNPLWVPETLTQRTQSGVPLYSTPGYLIDYLPDVNGVPAGSLYDAHTYLGDPEKVMS